ncbi:MAG: phosphoenolpyruvate--protein phosphotransferase [Planctomycetes bacterium]|nr:phosphoenolpyruvate--protein phosphotransferase [Planctomycetota bacterium]
MRKGVAVSPGVAVGTAYCIDEIFVDHDAKQLAEDEVASELALYETARDKVAAELHNLEQKVTAQVGEAAGRIFAVHASILADPAFTKRIRNWIGDEKVTAAAALQRLLNDYASLFARTKDEYLRERFTDIRDVVMRLSAHVSEVLKPQSHVLPGPLIVVTDELLPSQAVTLGNVDVRGIVTQAGSQTSHAAIIARSRGIPAVCGLRGALKHVTTGDTLVVDGREGVVLINPPPETLSAYRKLEREFFHLKDQLAANRDHAAATSDGVALELLANINNAADARAATAMGATGIGLFRTEYLYLTHPTVPDEDEQFQAYSEIIASSPGHRVTIRTLDIGGDKTVPYLGHTHQEANPFLGWRSIRLSFEHPDFFNVQLRAILRAAGAAGEKSGNVRLLFPMITTVEEIHKVRRIVRRAEQQLQREGKPYASVPLGMMLEVPAAAVSIRAMLRVVDFVSVGSNDLVQYLMAADRDNPKVNHLCQPLSPPVLRVLYSVIKACNKAGKPLTLCGEMAGQPRAFVLLLGMGLRSFSMSPAFIPSVKELATHLTAKDAQTILKRALRFSTTAGVKRFMSEQLQQLAPNLALLETT